MPEIKPFRALLYNPLKVRMDCVVAPPYDVITPAQRAELYKAEPHNIVRLILNSSDDPYTAAAKEFEVWLSDQVFVQDKEPALYVVSQRFDSPDGMPVERHGFIAATRIVPFGHGIYPHERTLSAPIGDRLSLFKATHLMSSQIFGLYSDHEGVLDRYLDIAISGKEFIDVTFEKVQTRAWRITDKDAIKTIAGYISDQRVVIADGHHRYKTAQAYCDYMHSRHPKSDGSEPYNFVPMYYTNMHAAGLSLLPTHRLISGLPDFQPTKLLTALERYFDLQVMQKTADLKSRMRERKDGVFGLALPGVPELVLLTIKSINRLYPTPPGKHPEMVDLLDVGILHNIILEKILGITPEQQINQIHLQYEKDFDRTLAAVKEGRAQAAFILNPTPIEAVRSTAEGGLLLPQKSTYFYPKLLSGVVNYSFIDS